MVRLAAVWSLMWVVMVVAPAAAQPPRGSGSQPPAGVAPPPAVVESKLGPIYVRDQNGATVLFPSITLEEINRLIEVEKQLQWVAQPPRFNFIPGAVVSGELRESAANLEVKLQVQVTKMAQTEPAWVRIPWRLNQAVLLPPVTHTGEGELLIEFDPRGDGYVAWLRAAPESVHTFTIRLKAPVLLKNGVRQMVLSLPDTATSFRLTVPGSGTEARVNGNMGNILSTRRVASGITELLVDAAGGEIDLSWREREELPPVLAAFGNILISYEGGGLEFDAQLNVRSYGPPIDSFIVRLPPGAELIATNQFTQPGLEYSLLPESSGASAGQRVLVRRTEGKTTGLIEARLRCQSIQSVLDTAAPWQLGGFEVLDARHQKGTVDFQADGEWSIDWFTDVHVRQVDDVPDGLRQQHLAARFEYDRQPFSLQTLIREKTTRVSVEPTWTVSVEARRLVLDGLLRYRVSGARPKPLEFETGGWQIQQVGPAELLADDWEFENNRLTVPLSPAVQTGAGELRLSIRATREHSPLACNLYHGHALPPLGPGSVAHWKMQRQSGQILFSLPRAISDTGLPAIVVIAPDDNIELVPSSEQLRRLVPDTLPPEISRPARQQQPFVYREDLGGGQVLFVGQFRVRPPAIAVTAETRVRIEERFFFVEQELEHSVLYVPVSRLRYLVPQELLDSGFDLLLDGTPTSPTPDAADAESADGLVSVAVELPEPRIGPVKVVFRHRHPRDQLAPRAASDLELPLVQLATDPATTLAAHRLRMTVPNNLAVRLRDNQWSVATGDGSTLAPGEMAFQSGDVPSVLRFWVTRATSPALRSTEVQKVWIQALLTHDERRDRACFRLTTNESSLSFRMPRGTNPNDITVAINGQRTDRFTVTNQLELRVDLGDAINAREITVELWYWFTAQPVPLGRVLLQAPLLEGVARADRVYWQLMLPREEHLAWYPSALVSENSWRRQNFFWSRQPRRTQGELESWVFASPQSDLIDDIPAGFNAYLFSSVGSLGPRTVYTVTWKLAVLGIAGSVLLSGAALLYLPGLRHPLLLLAAGVLVAAGALAFPEPTMSAAQLIAVGLALVLLARLLRSLFARPLAHRSLPRPSQLTTDSRATKQPSARVTAGSHVTTATLQAQVPMSTTGNEP